MSCDHLIFALNATERLLKNWEAHARAVHDADCSTDSSYPVAMLVLISLPFSFAALLTMIKVWETSQVIEILVGVMGSMNSSVGKLTKAVNDIIDSRTEAGASTHHQDAPPSTVYYCKYLSVLPSIGGRGYFRVAHTEDNDDINTTIDDNDDNDENNSQSGAFSASSDTGDEDDDGEDLASTKNEDSVSSIFYFLALVR